MRKLTRKERKQLRSNALTRRTSTYIPTRAAQDSKPIADATSAPDGSINSQAHSHQPKAPAFETLTINGGQFNV